MTFQNNFFNPDGTPYSPKVSDLLIPEPLGYTYVDTPLPHPPTGTQPPVVVGQYEKFKSLYAVSNVATANLSGVASFAASVDGPAATAAKYLEIPIDVDANALAPVARRRSPSSGLEVLSLTNARQQFISGARCYAFLRDVDYAQHANTSTGYSSTAITCRQARRPPTATMSDRSASSARSTATADMAVRRRGSPPSAST